jgi:hypothetical protein
MRGGRAQGPGARVACVVALKKRPANNRSGVNKVSGLPVPEDHDRDLDVAVVGQLSPARRQSADFDLSDPRRRPRPARLSAAVVAALGGIAVTAIAAPPRPGSCSMGYPDNSCTTRVQHSSWTHVPGTRAERRSEKQTSRSVNEKWLKIFGVTKFNVFR